MNGPSSVAPAAPAQTFDCSDGGAFVARVRAHARIVRKGWLQVFGIPDYERYLDHRAVHHPDEPVLSRREFFAQAIDRKYCRSGPRCC
jgi:uncharacterized short protein YbdD (DUF466 family)